MLYLMSTTVIPSGCDGTWKVKSVSLEEAKAMATKPWKSAIGHESTAQIMSELLELNVPMERVSVSSEVGDKFLCFKLNKRPPEGAILNRSQLEELGYGWCIMHYQSAE